MSQAPYAFRTVPVSNPTKQRAESLKIPNLRERMSQNMETSVSFALQSPTAHSTSYSKVGSHRRPDSIMDSYSKVSGYQPGKVSRSGDMMTRPRFAWEEEDVSLTPETFRESN